MGEIMSRTKGAKGKKNKRHPGRPKRSKKVLEAGAIVKPNTYATDTGIISPALSKAEKKALKRQYRELRRLKQGLKPGCPERIDIGKKMKEIKEKLAGQVTNSQLQETVIEEKTYISDREKYIEDILVEMKRININMTENFWRRFWSKPYFTEENLKEHLDIWKKKGI
jgi:hypothetical protein